MSQTPEKLVKKGDLIIITKVHFKSLVLKPEKVCWVEDVIRLPGSEIIILQLRYMDQNTKTLESHLLFAPSNIEFTFFDFDIRLNISIENTNMEL